MQLFNEIFPDVALKETLHIRTEDNDALPNGQYAFLEYYCGNLACRCTTMVLDVISMDDNDPKKTKYIAAISYSLQEPISQNNPALYEDSEQSDLAQAALAMFSHLVEHNSFISEKLNRHFEMVKNHFQHEKISSDLKSGVSKIKRNEPCPCGSNKKYKKCCLNS